MTNVKPQSLEVYHNFSQLPLSHCTVEHAGTWREEVISLAALLIPAEVTVLQGGEFPVAEDTQRATLQGMLVCGGWGAVLRLQWICLVIWPGSYTNANTEVRTHSGVPRLGGSLCELIPWPFLKHLLWAWP